MANFCFTFFIKKLPFRSASTFFLQLEFYFSLHILQHPTIFKEFANTHYCHIDKNIRKTSGMFFMSNKPKYKPINQSINKPS